MTADAEVNGSTRAYGDGTLTVKARKLSVTANSDSTATPDGLSVSIGVAAGAGPVYKLLGKKDMGTTDMPAIEAPLIDGEVAFRQHAGGHTAGPNWPTFLTFAGRYIKGPAAAKP